MNADASTRYEHKLCLKRQTMEKPSLLPTFCIFIPFFSLFLENAIQLTTLLTTNSKIDFHFFYIFFTSTTPFRSEPALRDHTCDATFMDLFVFYPPFSFQIICYLFSLRAQRDINCFKFMEKTKWCLQNKRQSRVQQNLDTMSVSPSSVSYQGIIMHKIF